MSSTNIEGYKSSWLISSVKQSLELLLVMLPIKFLLQDVVSEFLQLAKLSVQIHIRKLVVGYNFVALFTQNL